MNRTGVLTGFALLGMAPVILAQEASLRGFVTDPSGAVLGNVVVTATQTEKNISFTTNTGADGRYLFPRLPIGTHQIKAESPGFRTFVQSNVLLTTSAEVLLNITMQLGELKEQVTVSAEASRISTESSTLQQLVDSRRIMDMPLIGRNVYNLAVLVPGTGPNGMAIGGGRAGVATGSQNTAMVNVRVDGALNVDEGHSYLLPSPSPDAVQEFTIQTSVMPARYSHAAGVIEVSTKSGTNELHGTLYEFLRNDALDARNFFQPIKLKRRRNQYGVAAGGPIVLPKLYNGRNSTFWFLNFEQQKEPLTADANITVPTAQQLGGDFSQVARVIRDPSTNEPFANNQIPTNRLDPLALNLLRSYVPAAQDALGTYRYQKPADNNPTQLLGRGDQILSGGRHQISGRVFITRLTKPLAAGNLPAFSKGSLVKDTDITGFTYTTISANKINVVRFSVNRYYSFDNPKPNITLDELRRLGWASNYYTYTPDFPVLNVSGSVELGYEWPSLIYDNHTTTFSDEFSWIKGRHTVQTGFQGIRARQNTSNPSRTHGLYSFNGSLSGLGITDFLLGRPVSFRQGSPAPDNPRSLILSWFVQDDVKVNRRLTVNLGLRHELMFPIVSENNAMISYRPGAKSRVFVNAPPGLLFYGDPDVPRGGRYMRKTNLGPRIGLAYALTADQKTTLRIGYGYQFGPPITNVDGQFAIYQPFTRIVDVATPASTSNPWANWPGGNPHPYQPSQNSVFDPQIVSISYGPGYKDLSMQQWNLNIQREIAREWLVTVAYVGTRGTHIPYLRDMNPAVYVPGSSTVSNINQRRPLYPYFSRFSLIESVTNSSYNSFQASLDKRWSRGFSILAAYTFSKALTDLNILYTNNGGVQDPNNRRLEWGPSNYDRTHGFTTSWVWDVPVGSLNRGLVGVLLGRWQLNGITTLYSGAALSMTASADRALRGAPNRPDRLRDPRLPGGRPRAEFISRYFDTSAYAINQPGQFGSAPRAESQLRGPGPFDLTLGVMKNFRGLADSHRVQFRTEISNSLNRPNFNNPGANIDAPSTFGRITSAGDGRIIQLGLKYIF